MRREKVNILRMSENLKLMIDNTFYRRRCAVGYVLGEHIVWTRWKSLIGIFAKVERLNSDQ